MALTRFVFMFGIYLCAHLLLMLLIVSTKNLSQASTSSSTTSHGHSSQPSAAIVRRLYYAPTSSSSSSITRTNPYRSMVQSIGIRGPKGMAKVTPISLQSPSFDSNIRVSSGVSPNGGHPYLQRPSTGLIKVLEQRNQNQQNEQTNQNKTGSSRQGKSVVHELPSSSTTPTTTSTITASPQQPQIESLKNRIGENISSDHSMLNDNLCFLSHGGSSETFTVNEAVPVNSVIGTIKVIGDATDRGNIQLSIIGDNHDWNVSQPNNNYNNSTQQQQSSSNIPIRIEPGTKNLVLVRKLDKESVEGESSVTIGVRCRPRPKKVARKLFKHQLDSSAEASSDRVEKRISSSSNEETSTNQPSNWIIENSEEEPRLDGEDELNDDIIIPIRILVTDANDNKPEWQGTIPYSVNISEMATIGSVVMNGIRAIDNDQLGPFSTVEYYVEPGPYSHLLRFASPLEGTLILNGQLDYETLPNFWISIRAQDQGNPPNTAVTKVQVQVIDADDQNPRFEMDKYTAVMAEGQDAVGKPLIIKPKPIKAEDPDKGIQSAILYEFNSKDQDSRENLYFKIDPQTAQVILKRPLHSSISLPLTLVIRATQMDNRDRYALTTLTILSKRDQMMMPELRFLHSNYSTSLLESTPPGHVVLTVQTTSSANSDQPIRYQILDDEEQYFSIKNNGQVVISKMLDYEKYHRYSFRVMVTDGRQTDLARITVDIINVNEHDPIFGQSTYVFHVNEARLRSSPIIGQVQATDADDGDRIQLSLSGPHASAFALSTDGTLRLRSLRLVNTTDCHMIATATDSGTPPRSSSASLVVRFAPALLKSITGRHLESLLLDLEQDSAMNDGSSVSPTAVDILQHSAANIFSASTNSTALVLVIVLGVLLGTLFIIIVALTLHVLKNRKYESRRSSNCSPATLHQRHNLTSSSPCSSSSSSSSSSASSSSSSSDLSGEHSNHHLQWSQTDKTEPKSTFSNSVFSAAVVAPVVCSAQNKVAPLPDHEKKVTNEQPDSAISSDASCWSENKSSSNSQPLTTVTSNRSQSSNSTTDSGGEQTVQATNNTVASRISVIRWPQGSIPRRVKKLTWKDEQRNNHLDQMYTSNSTIVQAAASKTKTLSGHLLTGTSVEKPEESHSKHAHYHVHHPHLNAIRHHQTPHYPVAHSLIMKQSVDGKPTAQHHHHHQQQQQNQTSSTLPDLTVYF